MEKSVLVPYDKYERLLSESKHGGGNVGESIEERSVPSRVVRTDPPRKVGHSPDTDPDPPQKSGTNPDPPRKVGYSPETDPHPLKKVGNNPEPPRKVLPPGKRPDVGERAKKRGKERVGAGHDISKNWISF